MPRVARSLRRLLWQAPLALAVVLVAGSCRDAAAPAPLEPSPLLGLPSLGLLSCPTTQSHSSSAVIGPAGGTLGVGPHALYVPPGALASDVAITATAPAGDHVRVRFEPHGLVFAKQPALMLSYAHCGFASGLWLRVVYASDGLSILEVLPSLNDLLRQRTWARIDHFSNYMLAE